MKNRFISASEPFFGDSLYNQIYYNTMTFLGITHKVQSTQSAPTETFPATSKEGIPLNSNIIQTLLFPKDILFFLTRLPSLH